MIEPQSLARRDPGRLLAWGVLLLVLLFTAAVRVRLLSVPFERDEGEYAYAGQLILQGIPPYQLVYNMKLPGTYAAYALLMALFGQTVRGIHLGLLLLNAATIAVEFLLARRLFGVYAAGVAAASYGLLSLSPSVLGLFAHATHFVVLPALAGLLLLLGALDSGRLRAFFLSGVLLGLGFVMKQHGIFFVLFGGIYLLWERLEPLARDPRRPGGVRRLLVEGGFFSLGAALPCTVTCLLLWRAGVFGSFLFWTFDYARTYVTEVPLAALWLILPDMLAQAAGPATLIWELAFLGLTALVWNRETAGRRHFVIGLVIFSFLSICPGFYFRLHYFILLLPAVALLAGLAVESLRRLLAATKLSEWAAALPVLLFLGLALVAIYLQAPFFFGMTPAQASRDTYGPNPFPEAVRIGEYLRTHSAESDRIAVLGSEPEIFFYARRKSATGHIYMYGLMEAQVYALKMQQEAIREIEASEPAFLVLVDIPQSWLTRVDSERLILDWYGKYRDEHFDLVGLVEIVSEEETAYYWDRDATQRFPTSPYRIYIYRRKPRD